MPDVQSQRRAGCLCAVNTLTLGRVSPSVVCAYIVTTVAPRQISRSVDTLRVPNYP